MRNKKLLGALLAVTTLATFGLAGCGNSGSNGAASKEDDKTITVAASPTPHAEILNKAVKPLVEKDGLQAGRQGIHRLRAAEHRHRGWRG